jgi:hypothetical protein
MNEDFPKTLLEMERQFGTEEACRQYLTQLRWPTGFICPVCGGKVGWLDCRHRWTCQDCRRQTTVTAGTIFEGTHLPLQVWFRAAWLITSQKSGASALGIQGVLGWAVMKRHGVGCISYAAPWFDQAENGSKEPSRWTKHLWAA